MKFLVTDAREKKALKRAFLRFLPISVALIIVLSVLISISNYVSTKNAISQRQQSQIVASMLSFRNNLSNMTAITRAMETDYIELLAQRKSDADLETLLIGNIRQYPVLQSIWVLNPQGAEVLRVAQVNGEAYAAPPEKLADQPGSDSYLDMTLLGRHQFLFSGLTLDRENGQIALDPSSGKAVPILRISTPIETDGKRIGYLVVNFHMREYLDALRTLSDCTGCYLLLLDEKGYLYNDADDANNFGFCYGADAVQHGRTVYAFFPDIDLSAGSGSFIQDDKFCSFETFVNIYDRSKDYILEGDASKKLIFLIYYDSQSAYANDLHYSFLYHLALSWETQLLSCAGLLLLYMLTIYLVFLYDRLRFTNLFSDNRYTKTMLKQAIAHRQFVNYYQPIINIQDGTILGFEALSRWKVHDQVLPPSMFMDEIYHYRLGQMLDENVFLLARRDRKRMEQYESFRDTYISINCCQQTFNSLIKDPPGTIIRLTEAEKRYIVLELVEDIVFNQNTQARILEMYKQNILFAIDDFGTGNSNVSFIRSIENLKVKIDRTFVPIDTENHNERVIIEAFVKMFIDQGLKLIVEGVETTEQCRYLKKLGIAGVQGFYFSRPMTIDQLISFVESREYQKKL